MKNLPVAKRNQLIKVGLATVALIGGIYYFLILPQQIQNRRLANETSAARAKEDEYRKSIKQTEAIANNLTDISFRLKRAEEDIATGDVFAWTFDTIRRFKADYKLDIPNLSQPTVSDMDLLPDFPYKQVKVTLNGVGYYHDLGKFVADFENKFPHIRIENLTVEPTPAAPGSSQEKLSFRMDIVALVRPANEIP